MVIRADMLADEAEVLALARDDAAAREAASTALALHERKGNVAGAAVTRRLLERYRM